MLAAADTFTVKGHFRHRCQTAGFVLLAEPAATAVGLLNHATTHARARTTTDSRAGWSPTTLARQ